MTSLLELLAGAIEDSKKGGEMVTRGEWKQCLNPKCKGRYHIDENKIVDAPCKCLTKSLQNMRAFNKAIAIVDKGD